MGNRSAGGATGSGTAVVNALTGAAATTGASATAAAAPGIPAVNAAKFARAVSVDDSATTAARGKGGLAVAAAATDCVLILV
jgi:hypothetical protein